MSEDIFEEEIAEENEESVSKFSKKPQLTEEEIDHVADTAISVLQDIVKYFDIGEIVIDEYEGDEGELILDITGDDGGALIGRHGKTLDNIQLLVSTIVTRKLGFRYPLVIDVESYKTRQRQKLEAIAISTANRAVKEQRPRRMRPMTPYERRIVHVTLAQDDRVRTESEDEGQYRHVVVYPL
jgi:spoIIIJ-associated protein